MISMVKLRELKTAPVSSARHEYYMKSTAIDSGTPGCEAST
jgi:hypothetical protein